MIDFYNAFISYKHADLDNAVAAEIVRGLEHYHIPKKIQKATGKKKIDRIFRDKDELPITNNLNDTISCALRDAEYLIVICSTNTCKSTWVEKEIEIFLQNHDMSRVLTVLADGEPYDVIPKILLTEKKEVVDTDGVTHIVENNLEPLSCDFRLPKRKARAEELPRLAAVILGCSYDELMNRHRQYKMRRMTAIFAGAMALVIGFAGYMIYSNTRIHANYIESLRNQSIYLANQAQTKLKQEDRITAMQLAIEALPKDDQDERPVTPEAIKAITDASLSYVSLSGVNISAVWNFAMPNRIWKYTVSEDGEYVAAIDLNYNVKVWKTDTREEIVSAEAPYFSNIYFFGSDIFIVAASSDNTAYDLETGKIRWQNRYYSASVMLSYTDKSFLACALNGEIKEISVTDGTILNEYQPYDPESVTLMDYASKYTLSEDKKKLAFTLNKNKDDDNASVYDLCSCYLYEFNLETGETNSRFISDHIAQAIAYQGDNIYVACWQSMEDNSEKLVQYNYVTEDGVDIFCVTSGSLDDKWQQSLVKSTRVHTNEFLPFSNGTVGYYCGNAYCVWDSETGELIDKYNTNEPIVVGKDSNKTDSPSFITEGGSFGYTYQKSETSRGIILTHYFLDGLDEAYICRGAYVKKENGKEIIFYNSKACDEDWTAIPDGPKFNRGSQSYKLMDDILGVFTQVDDEIILMLYDAAGKTYIDKVSLGTGGRLYKYEFVGVYEGNVYFAYKDNQDERYPVYLYKYDLTERKLVREEIDSGGLAFDALFTIAEDKLVYCKEDTTDYSEHIKLRNLKTGVEDDILISEVENPIASFMRYYPGANKVAVMFDADHKCAIVDLATRDYRMLEKLPGDWEKTIDVEISGISQKVAATDNNNILLQTGEGEKISEIYCSGVEPMGMCFYEDNGKEILLVAYADGNMYRYDAETGQNLGITDFTTYFSNQDMYHAEFDFDEENRLLYVHAGEIMDMIDLDSWYEITAMGSCYGHHAGTDTFITNSAVTSKKESEVGYYKHYTTQDLIDKTKDLLQGMEMSDEVKAMYGIK